MRKTSIPKSGRRRGVPNICNGIGSKIDFSKDMTKMDLLKLRGKSPDIIYNGLEPLRNGAFIKHTVDYKLRVTLNLNFEKISTNDRAKTSPKGKNFCNGDMVCWNSCRTSIDKTSLLISDDN
jgi:hypothetical protein